MAFVEQNKQIEKFVGAYQTRAGELNFEKGDILVEGHFIGTFPNKYKPERPHLVFKNGDDEKVCLNTAGKLHYIFFGDESEIVKGDYLQVKYAGRIVLTKGAMAGKESHEFTVLLDADKSIAIEQPKQEKASVESNDSLDSFDPSIQ